MRLFTATIAVALVVLPVARARAQLAPISRSEAVRTAVERGLRLSVAQADTSLARAQIVNAKAVPNPSLAVTYSKAVPSFHLIADLPIDYPWLRRSRVASAEAGMVAADLRYALARATISLDADTTYTRALAARDRAALTRQNAASADSLLKMAISRRDAGDASELDVELATIFAGQQANIAAADSMTFVMTMLDLQSVLGMPREHLTLAPTDSLMLASSETFLKSDSQPLAVAAASSSVNSAELALRVQRRTLFGTPSVLFGIEAGDSSQPGILPTFGISLGLPLFNRNRGPIATAQAELFRAKVELSLAEFESRAQIARAERERSNALIRAERDRRLISSATRVASMSLTAYREGASALPNVLEAQRNVRDILLQYVDDLASVWIATSTLRALTITSTRLPSTPR